MSLNIIRDVEQLIIKGKIDVATVIYQNKIKPNVKRMDLQTKIDAANIARKLDKPLDGIKILFKFLPKTYASNSKLSNPKLPIINKMLVQYACCLIQNGSINEGIKILISLKECENANVLLYLAYAYFAKWEYEQAIPILQKYISNSTITEYETFIGKVNLAAAMVAIDHSDYKLESLEILIEQLKNKQYYRLYGNAHEILAQFHLNKEDITNAKYAINKSMEILSQNSICTDKIYAEKWKIILDLNDFKQKHNRIKILAALDKLKESAKKKMLWEVYRDCDFYKAKFTNDVLLLEHLYYGTPYENYRKKIESLYIKLTNKKLADNSNQLVKFKDGFLFQKLFSTLTTDFYRPLTITEIHDKIFTSKNFNPYSSANCVHQLVHRFKNYCVKNRLQFNIKQVAGRYSLEQKGEDVNNFKNNKNFIIGNYCTNISILKKIYTNPTRSFSRIESAKVLKTSTRSALRLLNKAITLGDIQKIGKSNSARYCFKDFSDLRNPTSPY